MRTAAAPSPHAQGAPSSPAGHVSAAVRCVPRPVPARPNEAASQLAENCFEKARAVVLTASSLRSQFTLKVSILPLPVWPYIEGDFVERDLTCLHLQVDSQTLQQPLWVTAYNRPPAYKHSRNFKKMTASRMSCDTTKRDRNDDFDTELLISLVRSRPTIWDKSLHCHTDHRLRSDAWLEVCRALCPEFERMSGKEKNLYAGNVVKKWMNLRDAWRKSQMESKVRKVLKPYIYHDHLRFLEKNWYNYKPIVVLKRRRKLIKEEEPISFIDSDDTNHQIPDNNEGHCSCQAKKAKNEERQDSENIMQYTDRARMEESPHVSFIRGLMPMLGKLSDDEVLEFQAGVVKLLLDIRKSKTPVISEVHYGYYPPNIDAEENVDNTQ
ncbi:uncharacterized protein LOC120631214 [Pararge aegeria]|uniref:uncharacterized protein LOC120631214 n=1 Tax=Pararge aegeria TaxID=116150 RepID=UPI0019D018EF|nr:uncharacterized protein LOC120631214 [Pararge aegeria]